MTKEIETTKPQKQNKVRWLTMLMDSLFHFRNTRSTNTAVLQRSQVRSSETMTPWNIVVFAWIVFESRAHRDEVNAKVMKDPRLGQIWPRSDAFRLQTNGLWRIRSSRGRLRGRARQSLSVLNRDRFQTRNSLTSTNRHEILASAPAPSV